MRRLWGPWTACVASVALLAAGLFLQAETRVGCQGYTGRVTFRGNERLAATASAPGVARFNTAHVSTDVVYSYVTVGPSPIRYRLDGQTPTSTSGHISNAHETLELCGNTNIANFRFLAEGAAGGEAHLNATHYIAD